MRAVKGECMEASSWKRKLLLVLAVGYLVSLGVTVVLADAGLLVRFFTYVRLIPYGDKGGHFLLTGLASCLLNLMLRCRTIRWGGQSWLWGSLVLFVFFTLEEGSQYWMTTRSFSWGDMLSNWLGIFFGGRLIAFDWNRWFKKTSAPKLS